MAGQTETITLKLVAQDLMSGNITKAISGLDALAKKGGLVGSVLQGMGQSLGQMTNPVALVADGIGAVTGAITDSLDAANKFDDQLRTINTVADVSDKTLGRMGDSIQQLSRDTGKTTDDLTAGFYDIVSAGVPAADAMDVLKNSAILATGALGTTGETVDLLTTTLNAYHIEAKESGRLTDIFAKAVADGKVKAGELGQTMATIAPIAAAAGVSLEEVAAGYAQLTKNGVPAAEAATQLRAEIDALITPNLELARIQQQVNINFADMARSEGLGKALQALRVAAGSDESFAKALGRVEALSGALLVTGDNAGAFAAELAAVKGAADKGGTALQQYTEKSKSAAEQQKRFDAEVQTLQQDLGEFIQPIYKALVGGATLVIQTIRQLGQAFHDFERFLSPHLAAVEDQDRALIDLAQQYGVSEDALLSFADAQRKAATDAIDQAKVVTTLQQMLSAITDNDAKNTLVSSLTAQLQKLADAAGIPIQQALFTLQGELSSLGATLTSQNSGAYLKTLASDLGLVTDAAGKVVPQLDAARQIFTDFQLASVDIKGIAMHWAHGFSLIGGAAAAAGESIYGGLVPKVKHAFTAMFATMDSQKQPWLQAWQDFANYAKDPFRPKAFADWLGKEAHKAAQKAANAPGGLMGPAGRYWTALSEVMLDPVLRKLATTREQIDALARVMVTFDDINAGLGNYGRNFNGPRELTDAQIRNRVHPNPKHHPNPTHHHHHHTTVHVQAMVSSEADGRRIAEVIGPHLDRWQSGRA